MAINKIATLGVKVDPRGAVAGANRAKRAITGIGKTASNVKSRVLSLQGALLGLGAAAILKSIITTAASVESLKVRLKFLTNSTQEATQAFKDMNAFASKVPFSLEEIERAAPLLLTVADNASELNNLLAITGDIAAVSGLSFEATAGQLQRAMAGGIAAADLFRERGVKAFLGFQEGVQYTAEETKKLIEDMWRDGTTTAVGATEELSKTFIGQVSMMQDAWRELKLAIADAGVFEFAKESIKDITKFLKDKDTIEGAKKLGTNVAVIAAKIKESIMAYHALPPFVRDYGLVFAIFGGTKGKIALGILVTQAETVGAILKGLGVQSFSAEEIHTSLKAVEARILDIKAALKEVEETDKSFLENVKNFLFAGSGLVLDDSVLKAYEKQRDELQAMWANLPILEQEAFLSTLSDTKEVEKVVVIFEELDKVIYEYNKQLEDAERKTTGYKNAIQIMVDANRKAEDGMHGMLDVVKQAEDGMHGMLDVVEKTTVATNFNGVAIEVMGEKFDEMARIALEAQLKIEEFANGLADSIENSIMRMTQGLMSFKDVVKSIFQYVAAQMVKMHIASPLADALSAGISAAMSGMITGSPTSNRGQLGGGGKHYASGGRPPRGQASIVGERGAELFVPDSSGTIVPNNQLGGQTINVTYAPQVNALDPRTAQSVIAENAPTIVGVVRQAFERNGQQVAI